MRKRAILRLLAALSVLVLFAAACGEDDSPVTADAGDGVADDDMADDDMVDDDMADDDMADGEHEHDGDDPVQNPDGEMHEHDGMVAVAAEGAPEVAIDVVADPAGGVNIRVTTENFTASPESASSDHVDGQGHFHLYVDGEKVLRFYNEWIYYAGVVEGDVEIAVGLSANDHRAYAIDGAEIRAAVTFTVPEHAHSGHSHEDPTAVDFVGDAPTIGLDVVADAVSGWNAFITLDGMTLSPENASTDHVDGEGHLHIYANGQKLGRLYGSATHLSALPDGDVEISVVAYTNDHNPYLADGQPISAATMVTVSS